MHRSLRGVSERGCVCWLDEPCYCLGQREAHTMLPGTLLEKHAKKQTRFCPLEYLLAGDLGECAVLVFLWVTQSSLEPYSKTKMY
ncbi:hypothetical protein E2C01_095246 [Portunus trituberculatus]|uniref:Uncharacterized protein n=1 Tax=Portunus trituberculatus TaxID=210409 RepID=A0A5B7JZP2_PORTR|nr:hypothetical protein [Portunus trituberculatus]